jgi:hypothetical protein
MLKVLRIITGATVTMVAAFAVVMIVWAHGRSAPASQPLVADTNLVKAVQLRFTLDGGHWANVTEVEGGTITVEREGKKLAITPYIRDGGRVELQVLKAVQSNGKETMQTAGALLVGKELTKLEAGGMVFNVQVVNPNKMLPANVVAAAAGGFVTCCVRACDGTLFCGLCVCTDCGRCGPGWCDCPIPGPPDV